MSLSPTQRVASVLLKRGRMTVRELGRYVNMTTTGRSTSKSDFSAGGMSHMPGSYSEARTENRSIPIRLIQQSLMILIQHHCVLHSSHSREGADQHQEEYFEPNIDEILTRLRFGMYLDQAQQWGGDIAENVVKLLLFHGQMRAGDIIDSLATVQGDVLDHVVLGSTEPVNNQEASRIAQSLVRMLQESFVRPSTAVQHVSRQDREIAYELMLRKSFKGIPTAKTLKEFKIKVAQMIDEEDRREWETPNHSLDEPRLGLKRKTNATHPREKRSKKHAHSDVTADRADAEHSWDIDRDVWLRVNYDRFNVRIRNDILVRAVAQKYNTTTGEIFRAMLTDDRPGPVRCEMDERSRPITINSLSHSLPSGIKAQRGLDKRSILGDKGSSHPTTTELLAEYVAILTNHDNISSSVRGTRFIAPFGNATTTSAGGTTKVPTTVTVEYINIVRQLQMQMVRDVVVERFGATAGRIFSILVEKGKLEEKHVRYLTYPDLQNWTYLHG